MTIEEPVKNPIIDWWFKKLDEYINLIENLLKDSIYGRIMATYITDNDNAYIVLDSEGPYIVLHFQDDSDYDEKIRFVDTIEIGELKKILENNGQNLYSGYMYNKDIYDI